MLSIVFFSVDPEDVSCPDKNFDGLLSASKVVVAPIGSYEDEFEDKVIEDAQLIKELALFANEHETGWYAIVLLGPYSPSGSLSLSFYDGDRSVGNYGFLQGHGLIFYEGCHESFYQYLQIPRKARPELRQLLEKVDKY